MSNSLWTHEVQYTRLPSLSLSPRVCSNSYPLSWWCYPTISSSVAPFPCPQSFPASGSFPVSRLFATGGQSIRASVFPTNIQGWFPLGLAGFISLLRDSQESSPAAQFSSINSLVLSFLYSPTLTCIHDYWKNHSFDDLCWQSHVSAFQHAI